MTWKEKVIAKILLILARMLAENSDLKGELNTLATHIAVSEAKEKPGAKDFHRESVAGAISAILPDLHELWMQEWEQVGHISAAGMLISPGRGEIPDDEPVYRRKAQP